MSSDDMWRDPYDPLNSAPPQYGGYQVGGYPPPGAYGQTPAPYPPAYPGSYPPGMPQGYGPPGYYPGSPASQGAAVAALVINSVFTLMLCGFFATIPGIVCAAIALGKIRTNPPAARKLIMWSWICLGIAVVLMVAFFTIGITTNFGEPRTTG